MSGGKKKEERRRRNRTCKQIFPRKCVKTPRTLPSMRVAFLHFHSSDSSSRNFSNFSLQILQIPSSSGPFSGASVDSKGASSTSGAGASCWKADPTVWSDSPVTLKVVQVCKRGGMRPLHVRKTREQNKPPGCNTSRGTGTSQSSPSPFDSFESASPDVFPSRRAPRSS